MSKSLYHRLRVTELVEETHDSMSVLFAPPDQPQAFTYKPGQFLTLRIPGQAQSIARCYSLASAPQVDAALKVTIKRVRNGLGSNWICDNLRAGDELEVLPPAGVFCPSSLDVDLLLCAGGSGITPIMSILKSCLAQGSGKVFLFYANRDERSVIFREELQRLGAAYPHRLTVMHWLETVQGLPTANQLAGICQGYAHAHGFICGPGPFMDAAEITLLSLGMARNRVHVERFVSLTSDPGCWQKPRQNRATARLEWGWRHSSMARLMWLRGIPKWTCSMLSWRLASARLFPVAKGAAVPACAGSRRGRCACAAMKCSMHMIWPKAGCWPVRRGLSATRS